MGQTRFASGRQLDLICLGRLGVDLYAQQVGARLEDVSSFAKYLGGSSANIAFGTARLGLKSAMLSRVGDDHMGRFLVESLAREGCDVSGIKVDPERLTALVLLGLRTAKPSPWCSTAKTAPTWPCVPKTSTKPLSRRAKPC